MPNDRAAYHDGMTTGIAAGDVGPRRDRWLLDTVASVAGPDAAGRVAEAGQGSLWASAVTLGVATDAELVQALAARLRLRVADLSTVDHRCARLLPERVARRYAIVPLAATPAGLDVATADPYDLDCERALRFASGREVRFLVASPSAIARATDEIYRLDAAIGRLLDPRLAHEVEVVAIESRDDATRSPLPESVEQPMVRLVDQVLADAVIVGASDVHIELTERTVELRHRVDGVLRSPRSLPRAVGIPLVSRLKILAGLDIADRLRPQDGRARIAVDGAPVDLRVSTLPAAHGEKVVVRLLDTRTTVLTLDRMGFDEETQSALARLGDMREGLVLVTGPTGSGKTTTLHALLRRIQQRAVNIVTVEDPVEYRVAGVAQVQVSERSGLTFATALRAILRQDPDVILVGEIRDRETAAIAIQSALTGHLVLTSLHTLDAAGALTRLSDLGGDPARLASALRGVVAQRLVRRSCGACRGIVRTPMCADCGGSGFRGRLAVAEVLMGGGEVESLIAAHAEVPAVVDAARRAGFVSLWDRAIALASSGATTVAEVRRVLDPPWQARGGSTDIAAMASLDIGTVDVYVIRPLSPEWRVLVLQRAPGTRCAGAWEAVHGRIEPGEQPEDAAARELAEETGLAVDKLYNVTVQPFYLHTTHSVQLAVVFAALVTDPASVRLGDEHVAHEWLAPDDAAARFAWPRERESLAHIRQLLRAGDAGVVEDVLRVR
ncbi:MAG: hypothetical protein NVS1B4_08610 [Gemmatimonadaceae bacterium]